MAFHGKGMIAPSLHGLYPVTGRSIDGGGQEHYLAILKRKGDNGRGTILHDIAHSREAYLNRTAQASAWRFIARANSRSMRWRETGAGYAREGGPLNAMPGKRDAWRHWNPACIARRSTPASIWMPSAEKFSILSCPSEAQNTSRLLPPFRRHTLMPQTMRRLRSRAPRRSCGEALLPPGPSLSLKMLLSDSSAERQVPHIAQAIRAELKQLGIN
jgi:hypothetical protein